MASGGATGSDIGAPSGGWNNPRRYLTRQSRDPPSAYALPDPDDRHVLAAAVRCGADVILTFNLSDFPTDVLGPLGIEARHPDVFLLRLLETDPARVLTAVKRQRASLKNPPVKSLDFLDTLERQQLSLAVAELRRFADLI